MKKAYSSILPKKFLFVFVLFCLQCINAQKENNELHGYYEEKGSETFYKSFSFDGNGKVMIGGMDYGDYFTRNDSIVIYPDKSIFILTINKGQLKGISSWVEKGVWVPRKDTIVANHRTDSGKAQKKAELLAEYFDKTKKSNDFEVLFSDEFSKMNEGLCNKGLAKACMNLFGIKMLQYTPGVLNSPEKIASKKLKPHPELIALSSKIISLGEPEGYTVLGSYYYTLGLRDKAFQTWDEGEKNGSIKSGMTKAMIEFEEELNAEVKASDKQ